MVCSTLGARQNDTKMKSQLHFPAEHWVAKVGRFGGYPGRTISGRFHVLRPTDLIFQHFPTIKKPKCSSQCWQEVRDTSCALSHSRTEMKLENGLQAVNFELE